ncbi:glycoside hydrolase family 13 protein [Infundibulicybe gibba]|nr:glycoside hydrolase family 13 protein [Infundibulicybe gibba]
MFISTLALGALLAAPCALAATPDEWRSRTIYQVVTDRFATNNDTSATCDSAARKYCGGTWQGIIKHLDYIQGMGFDAVWISPIVANVDGQLLTARRTMGTGPGIFNTLNSHYGTADDLKALSSALHSRKMFLMVDVVVNHLVGFPKNGTAGQAPEYDFSTLAPFNQQSNFHPECLIKDYNNQTDVEQCWLGDEALPLADLNTEDPAVVKTMNDWIGNLVKTYSIDGVRVDTVKHIRKDFWPDFVKSAGVYTIGEVLSNETTYTKDYTNVMDGVLDYPTWFPLVAAFQTVHGNFSALASTVTASQQSYKNGTFLAGSFVENHDQPRFQSLTTDQALVKNIMAWPFVQDGIPILYYGQEQGYTGTTDPMNREALWFSGYATDKPLVNHVKSLVAMRKAAATANTAFLTTPVKFLPQTDASTMMVSKPPMLALFTNAGNASASGLKWTVPAGTFKANEAIVDVLTCTASTADGSGGASVAVAGGMPQVILPATAMAKGGALCPSVATGTGKTNSNSSSSAGVRFVPGMFAAAGAAVFAGLVHVLF